MDLRLDGKVALVTGGSRGIGKAIAKRFAQAGAAVLISSRKAESLEAAAAEIAAQSAGSSANVTWFAANAGRPEEIEACVDACLERLGSLDILVNNAATNPYMGLMLDIDVPRAEKTVQVNQLGVLLWCQQAWRSRMSEHGGAIVNMASVGGLTVEPAIGYYNVTKAAVIHMTRHLAVEMAPGVRVNAIAPGLVKTDFARALWEPAEAAIAERLPLRRLGEPDDIARAALFLASDASSWMTGQTVVVDGGATLGLRGGVG
ncbi:MAG: SDR family oxidoreductase [Actinobacteria bacterium]|nr:SDR family oxidoreductase [Actinomycetota bacterium]